MTKEIQEEVNWGRSRGFYLPLWGKASGDINTKGKCYQESAMDPNSVTVW